LIVKIKNEENALKRVERIWQQVFTSTDPYEKLFPEAFNDVIVFHETDGPVLREDQFFAVRKAMEDISEDVFYFSVTEGGNCFASVENPGYFDNLNWLCHNPSYEECEQLIVPLESSIYSTKGTWGIMISQDFFGVIGGNKKFIDALKNRYSLWESDLKDFYDFWHEEKWYSGLDPRLLKSIEKAKLR